MPSPTLRVVFLRTEPLEDDAERRRRHSHGGPWERDSEGLETTLAGLHRSRAGTLARTGSTRCFDVPDAHDFGFAAVAASAQFGLARLEFLLEFLPIALT
jgi:hypothetical protein